MADIVDPELVLPAEYTSCPVTALRMTSRKKLGNYLDLEGMLIVINEDTEDEVEVLNNFHGLVELAGMDYQSAQNFERKENPTQAFLNQWNGPKATVGNLWQFLMVMNRHDVVQGCRKNILTDCRVYRQQQEIEQDAAKYSIEHSTERKQIEMNVDETKYACKDDVLNPQPDRNDSPATEDSKTYHAFVCYTMEDENDRKFIRTIIENMETRRGLKLFVPGRDDLPGAAEYNINAFIIEKRCKRTIILLSNAFYQSAACDFQFKFAFSLAPGARSKKLIPVIKDKGIGIPRVLRHVALLDFTKKDMEDWAWDRMQAALLAPIGKITYFADDDINNPFRDITDLKQIEYPSSERRLFDDESVVSSTTGPMDCDPPEEQPRTEYTRHGDTRTGNQPPPLIRGEIGRDSVSNVESASSGSTTQKKSFFRRLTGDKSSKSNTKKVVNKKSMEVDHSQPPPSYTTVMSGVSITDNTRVGSQPPVRGNYRSVQENSAEDGWVQV